MTDPSPKRRALPPFEQTLAGHALSLPEVAFSATLGRDAYGETIAASSLPPPPAVLPQVSIDLGEARSLVAGEAGPDLRIVGKLGEGGMGVVHLAEQRSLERTVAIKTPRQDAPAHVDAALCDEAVLTGRLEHPNIVPVHAFGRTPDGRPVMVMKRIEGVAWRTLLDESDHPLWDSIGTGDRLVDQLELLHSLCNALAFAHSRSVVHRDVKPENVLVGAFGEVVLVDFGLAVRTDRPQSRERGIVGTPAFMAPEMVAGWDVDARTDVYLLGGTLHEILTGRPPHDGETLTAVLARAYASAPPVFDHAVPEELAAICARALARHPDDRFPDVRSLRDALQGYLTHRASHALARRGEERLLEARRATEALARRAALTEARFACRQAIEQWSANVLAIDTERAATLDALDLELGERNLGGARALLHGLVDPPVALVDRVEALARSLEEERRKADRMSQIEHDMDQSVGAGARRIVVLLLAAAGFAISIYISRRNGYERLRARDLVPVAAVMFVFVTTVIGTMWRSLASNAFGRKLAIVGWSANVMMFFHRVVATIGDEPVPNILAVDSIIFTAMLAATGVLMDPRLLLGLPVTAAGAVVAMAYPERAPQAFSGSVILLMLVAAAYYGARGRGRST